MKYFAQEKGTDSDSHTILLEEYLPSLDDLAEKLNDNNRFSVDTASVEKLSALLKDSYNKANPFFWSANEMLITESGVAVIESNPYAGEAPSYLPDSLRKEMAVDYVKNLLKARPDIRSAAVEYLHWEKFPLDIAKSLEERGIGVKKFMEKEAGTSEFDAEPPDIGDIDEIIQFGIGLPKKWKIRDEGQTKTVFSQLMMDAKVSQLATFNYFEKKGIRTFTPASYLVSDKGYLEKALDIFSDYGVKKIVTKGVDDISFGGRNTKFWGLNGTSADEIPAYYNSLESPIILQEFVDFVPITEVSKSKKQVQVRKKGYRFLGTKVFGGEETKKEYAYNVRLFTLPDESGIKLYGGFAKLGRAPIATSNGDRRISEGKVENKYNTSAHGGAIITYDKNATPLEVTYKEKKDVGNFTLPVTKHNIGPLSIISQAQTAMLAGFYEGTGSGQIYDGLKKICGLPNMANFG